MIEYEVFKPSDADSVVRLLGKSFSTAEPPAVAVGLSSAELERFVSLVCPRAAADGLTIVARELESRQIAGVLLTDDFAAPLEVDPEQISPKFRAIFAMLGSLDKQYQGGRKIATGEYLHLFMIAVDEAFTGRGIAQRMVEACLANGRRRGYTHAVTEATGVVSQHVFRKLGFVERVRVSYQDYRYEGHAVFERIREHEGAVLMDRRVT